jgi:hypothetical protein
MERHSEEEQPPSSEEGEALHINSIVIPADEEFSLSQRPLERGNLTDYRELVDGEIEGISLLRPPARMYVNEEGKLRGLPMNRRATLLLWMHNKAFRYGDIIAGNAFLLGPTGDDGGETAVPEEYAQLLFRAESFHVEAHMRGGQQLPQHIWPFDNWLEAYAFALEWALGPGNRQRPEVADVRVVPDM